MAVIAIGQDRFETEDFLRQFYTDNGYSWPMAALHQEVVDAYEVEVRSTKYGIDRNGVIALKAVYGQSVDDWKAWFDQVLAR